MLTDQISQMNCFMLVRRQRKKWGGQANLNGVFYFQSEFSRDSWCSFQYKGCGTGLWLKV